MALALLNRPLVGDEGALTFPLQHLNVNGTAVDIKALSKRVQLFFVTVDLRRAPGGEVLMSDGLQLARLIDRCRREPDVNAGPISTALVPYLMPRRYHGIGAGGSGWGGRPASAGAPPHPALKDLRFTRRVPRLLYACDCDFVVLFRAERVGEQGFATDEAVAAAVRDARTLLPECPWVNLADLEHRPVVDELNLELPGGMLVEAVFAVDSDGFVGHAQLMGALSADIVYVQLTQHLIALRRCAEHAAGFACQMADYGAGGLRSKCEGANAAAKAAAVALGSQALPPDLLMQVLEFVGPRRAWRAAQVCRLWRLLLQSFLSEQLRRQSEGIMLRLPRVDSPGEFLVLVPPPPAYTGEGDEPAPWDAYPPTTLCPLYGLGRLRRDVRGLLAMARLALGEEETVKAVKELREEGNAHYRNGQLALALECYMDALEMVPIARHNTNSDASGNENDAGDSTDIGGSGGGGGAESGGLAGSGGGGSGGGQFVRTYSSDVGDGEEGEGEPLEEVIDEDGVGGSDSLNEGASGANGGGSGSRCFKRQRSRSPSVSHRLAALQASLLSAAAAVHLRQGRRRKVMEACTCALELDPTHARALLLRGRLHMLQGSHKRALRDLQRLVAQSDTTEPGMLREASSLLMSIRGWS